MKGAEGAGRLSGAARREWDRLVSRWSDPGILGGLGRISKTGRAEIRDIYDSNVNEKYNNLKCVVYCSTLDFYSFPENLCVHVYVLGRSTYLSYPILYKNFNLFFSSLFLFSLTVQLSVDWRVVLANGSNHFIYDGPIVFFSDSSGAGGLKTNNWKQELNNNKSEAGGRGVARSIKLNDLVIPGGQAGH